MDKRYNRENFLNTEIDENGVPVLNPVTFSFKDFNDYIRNKNTRTHTVDQTTAHGIDLVSSLEYGTENYWWILSYVNGIEDPFIDLPVGKELIIPALNDIENYYKQSREAKLRNTVVSLTR